MATRDNRHLARNRNRNGSGATASLKELAYEAIKRRITTLKYRPGEYLNEWSICLELGQCRAQPRAVFDAIAAHDSDKASAAIETHIASFGRSIKRAI